MNNENNKAESEWDFYDDIQEVQGGAAASSTSGPFPQESRLSGKKNSSKVLRLQSQIVKKPYRELTDLQHLHHFKVSEEPIWVVKFRQDGKYLATGGRDCVLRVYQILPVYYNERNTATLFNSGQEHSRIVPFKQFENGHKKDILDINWCPREPYENYLLTAGADMKVIIWNLNDRGKIQELSHRGIVTCAIFHVSKQFCIATGCSDKTIRLWRINTSTVTNWQ